MSDVLCFLAIWQTDGTVVHPCQGQGRLTDGRCSCISLPGTGQTDRRTYEILLFHDSDWEKVPPEESLRIEQCAATAAAATLGVRGSCIRADLVQGTSGSGQRYTCIWLCVCMYVCMCVCMYVCMYVCMCMYICMCVCMCVCMYVCVYVCIMYVCVCMYVCMYLCMCMYICMCMCVCVCVYVCMYVYVYMYICMCVCMYVYMYVCVCVYVCIYVCMCVCVCIYIYIYICTYINISVNKTLPPLQYHISLLYVEASVAIILLSIFVNFIS